METPHLSKNGWNLRTRQLTPADGKRPVVCKNGGQLMKRVEPSGSIWDQVEIVSARQ